MGFPPKIRRIIALAGNAQHQKEQSESNSGMPIHVCESVSLITNGYSHSHHPQEPMRFAVSGSRPLFPPILLNAKSLKS
jgi:hypothetical protein